MISFSLDQCVCLSETWVLKFRRDQRDTNSAIIGQMGSIAKNSIVFVRAQWNLGALNFDMMDDESYSQLTG